MIRGRWLLGLVVACSRSEPPAGALVEPSAAPELGSDSGLPVPLPGMVWIPPGPLVVGTPPDRTPRIADQEMAGEQVMLKGFYIDVYPYPNEPGAIPLTGLNQAQAGARCAELGKRLCTELEWERACKGPEQHVYEYGDRYQSRICATGRPPALLPSGIHTGCVSDFGVRDLHGGVWEWTSSRWGRGETSELVTVRGGNGLDGQVVGRCAHAAPRRPQDSDRWLGFRCCSGPANQVEVTLEVRRGERLVLERRPDRNLSDLLVQALPEAARSELKADNSIRFDRLWLWRPIGNEELLVAGTCTGLGIRPACGVLVARRRPDRVSALAWVSSGYQVPVVQADVDARALWLFGADRLGKFRCLVDYHWGEVRIGPRERQLPRPEDDRQPKRRQPRRKSKR